MENKLEKYSNDEIIEILNNSKSFREALIKFEYSSNGTGGYVSAKRIIKNRNIIIPKYNYYGDGNTNPKYKLDEILVENSTYTSRTCLKKRLVDEGLLKYMCAKCGNNGEWKSESLSLQLEHKNGVNNDNRLENLEFLCPNCHSQSKTFAGRNNRCSFKKKTIKPLKSINSCACGAQIKNRSTKCQKCHHENLRKVKSRPSYGELINDITFSNYTVTGKKHGVSDNTIRKWLKFYEKQM